MSPDKKEGDASDWMKAVREAGPYLGLGTSLAATVLLGLALGYWGDWKLGTKPWLFLLGGALGLGTALYQFVKMVGSGKR